MPWFCLSANFLISSSIIHTKTTNEACRGEYSVVFLKGHTFETITVDSPARCQTFCSQDVTCQSFNFIIGKHICELNNRTKDARPKDFVGDAVRYGGNIIYLQEYKISAFGFNNRTFPKSFKTQQQI